MEHIPAPMESKKTPQLNGNAVLVAFPKCSKVPAVYRSFRALCGRARSRGLACSRRPATVPAWQTCVAAAPNRRNIDTRRPKNRSPGIHQGARGVEQPHRCVVIVTSISGFRFKVVRPQGTRFETPRVCTLSPRSLSRGWARPLELADVEALRSGAQRSTESLPTARARRPNAD